MASAPVAKRRRVVDESLASLLAPTFNAVPWEHNGKLQEKTHMVKMGPDGTVWAISDERGRPGKIQLSAVFPDGTHDIVAFDWQAVPTSVFPFGRGEIMFLNESGAICKASAGAGVSVIADADARCFSLDGNELLILRNMTLADMDVGEDDLRQTLERRDLTGALRETLEISFLVLTSFIHSTKRQTMFFITGSALMKLDLRTQKRVCIAGVEDEKGFLDGHGSDARFNSLKFPHYDEATDCVYVRDMQPDLTSRFCRINLSTFKVTTIDIQGIQNEPRLQLAWRYPYLLFITEKAKYFHVDMRIEALSSTFVKDMASIDWSLEGMIKFQLPAGEVACADRRVLCARSAFFAALLKPEHGMKESRSEVIDFTMSDVNPRVFRAILSYLATDDLGLSSSDGAPEVDTEVVLERALFCIDIAVLADQYHLLRLQRLAEAFVLQVAVPGRDNLVLPLLERTWQTNSRIEQACWEAIDRDSTTILESFGEDALTSFLDRIASRMRTQLLLRVSRRR